MKISLRTLGNIFIIFIIVFFVISVTWYVVSFFQYKDKIDCIIFDSQKEYGKLDDSLYKLAVIAESEKGILLWASQRAYWDIASQNSKNSNIVGKLNSLLWHFCIKLHYNQNEIFMLWCHYSLNIGGYGLNNAALKYFGKNIKDLSLKQKAAIVAMVRDPTRYNPGSEQSKARVEYILAKYYEK